MAYILRAALASVLTTAASAQTHTLLFALDADASARHGRGFESALLRAGEVALVTPRGGSYSATVFLSGGAQWAYVGDRNNNGRLVDTANDAPGAGIDEIFVRRFPTRGPSGPRDVFVSKAATTGLATTDDNGSLFRYSSQGLLEVFVAESQLAVATGQAGTADVNTDAFCQDNQGNLYLSFASVEPINGTNVPDGAIVHIPASAISYGPADTIIAIQPGSALVIADEPNVVNWIVASGVQTATRNAPSRSINTGGLEIDPDGGTWTSQVNGLSYPNLLFGWRGSGSNGAILTTAGGGRIARINGVAMGSTVETNGSHLGLMPGSLGVGGISGLALVPNRSAPPAVELWPTSLVTRSTTLFTRAEVSNATPGGPVFFFADVALGPSFPTTTIPGFRGELFGAGLIVDLGAATADTIGYAFITFQLPPSVVTGSRFALVWQCLDVRSFTFAQPAAMQFL